VSGVKRKPPYRPPAYWSPSDSVGKILRLAGAGRTTLRLDLYNALNKDTVVLLNNSFAVWQQPTDIVPARFAKFTVTFDF
jgi:hypothetical protein